MACWSADIYSFQKEREQGALHNLVLLAQRERDCSLADALKSAVRACDDEVRHFERLALEPPRLAHVDETQAVQAYAQGLRELHSGRAGLAAASPRYA